MDCDYCGNTARWDVSTGERPLTGMTRYVCDLHLPAACGHVSQVGLATVTQLTRRESPRSAA